MEKRTVLLLMIILSVVIAVLSSCGQRTPTWQEQYDLGIRYLSEGNYEEAVIAFTTAVEIDPKRPEPYLKLADVYQAVDDSQLAIAILRDGIAATGNADLQALLDELTQVEPLKPEAMSEHTTQRSGKIGEYDYILTFNELGQCIRKDFYQTDGTLAGYHEIAYDGDQMVSYSMYAPNGSLGEQSQYLYDSAGNLIQTDYIHPDGTSGYITYEYENGRIVRDNEFRDMNSIHSALVSTYIYNEAGLLIRKNTESSGYVLYEYNSSDVLERAIHYWDGKKNGTELYDNGEYVYIYYD